MSTHPVPHADLLGVSANQATIRVAREDVTSQDGLLRCPMAEVVASFSLGEAPSSPPGTKDLCPGLTVAICTYRRAASLARFLDSLAGQERKPDHLILVDASPDVQTESMLRARQDLHSLAGAVSYFRVGECLRGLTKQRNFAARWVQTDLLAFFDDDIVLLPGCLRELENTFFNGPRDIVGVGAFIQAQQESPSRLWRLRVLLGMVTDLQPGRYFRTGFSTSWSFVNPTAGLVPGDWLHGGCVMWRTSIVLELGFYEGFGGYAQGEDLEFSLRAGRRGRLLLNTGARLLHLAEPVGRPNHFRLGFMAIHNRFMIHRRCLPHRNFVAVLSFCYAWLLDSVLLLRGVCGTPGPTATMQQLAGRFCAALSLFTQAVSAMARMRRQGSRPL